MPIDPQVLQLMRLQGLVPQDPQPQDVTDGAPAQAGSGSPAPFGIDPTALARAQNGLPSAPPPVSDELAGAPGAATSSTVNPPGGGQGNTIPQAQAPSDSPVSPRVQIGQAHGEPIPNGVQETSEGKPIPALPTSATVAPPIDDSIAGSPAYQRQASDAGPPSITEAPKPGDAPKEEAKPLSFEDQIAQRRAAIDDGIGKVQAELLNTPNSDIENRVKLQEALRDLDVQKRGLDQAQAQHDLGLASVDAQKQMKENMDAWATERAQQQQRMEQQLQRQDVLLHQIRSATPNRQALYGDQGTFRGIFTTLVSAGVLGTTAQSVLKQKISEAVADETDNFNSLTKQYDAGRQLMTDSDKYFGDQEAYRVSKAKAIADDLNARAQAISARMSSGPSKDAISQTGADVAAWADKQYWDLAEKRSIVNKNDSEAYKAGFYKGMPLGGHGGGGGTGAGMAKSNEIWGGSPTPDGMKFPVKLPDRNGKSGGYITALGKEQQGKANEILLDYSSLDDAEEKLQEIMLARDNAKSKGGSVWKKWQDTQEQQAQQMFVEASQLWAKVVHGRPPGKFTMQEIGEEYPGLKAAWESGDSAKILGFLRDAQDRQLNKKLHVLVKENLSIPSERPAPAEQKGSPEIATDVVGDFVPGTVPDVGNSTDALNQYIDNYRANRKNGSTDDMVKELSAMEAKARANQKQATAMMLKAKTPQERMAAIKQQNAYQAIAEAINSKIPEVKRQDAKKKAADDPFGVF